MNAAAVESIGIAPSEVRVTTVSWSADEDLDLAQWIRAGHRMGLTGRSAGWWLGDWLRYGNTRYGEKYSRAARITGYDTQTLMNMVYVASRIHPSRRREKLSWSHHAEVAAREPDAQERWLARAECDRLSVRDLRDAVRRRDRATEPVGAAEGEHELATAHVGAPGMRCPACGYRLTPEVAA